MSTRHSPREQLRRGAGRLSAILVVGLSVAGCHPGNQEARQLRDACAAGTEAACNDFGQRLLTGRYVLRDEAGAAR
ncbi:MAG: hypothetical protein JNJ80_05805, partial [Gemmatimonadetes bacterium]|nr:hypothetical protein [Gemmatimonadota bacterium]